MTDSKGEGKVNVIDVSTETEHYSSDHRKMLPKIIYKKPGVVVYASTVSVTLTLADSITFISKRAESYFTASVLLNSIRRLMIEQALNRAEINVKMVTFPSYTEN